MDSILFIAPSTSMAQIATQIIADMGLNIPVEIGVGKQVIDISRRYPERDIIISRGGAADNLKRMTDKTIVPVTITMSDLLRSINVIVGEVKKIGIVGHKNMFEDMIQDIQFLDVEIFLRPSQNNDETVNIVGKMTQWVEGIVGDVKAVEVAKQHSLKTEPLIAGQASIKRAIDEAISITEVQIHERTREKERALQIQNYASEIYAHIEQAAAAIEQLTASSEELSEESQQTANIASMTSQEVSNTVEILEITRRVSQQINLLGLNAAIEAARAGEFGRGFAVVADEVRKLADESHHSTKNINNMLNKFQESVNQMLRNIEQTSIITSEQSKATQEVAHMMEALKGVSHKMMQFANINV